MSSPAAGWVLIVEDDVDVRDTLCDALESLGYQVGTATDGADALRKLHAASSLPAVILLDLMMPVMDGWEFREQQRATPALAPIPVILLSARAEPSFDADVCLRKPVGLDVLGSALERYCAPRRGA